MDDWMATVALPSNSRDENQPNIPDALRSEIQIMEALRGAPNIVIIEDFAYRRVGQTSTLLVRMELLKSLQEVLPGRNGQGTLSSIREITKLGKDVCRALMYCEKRGIIHRDIKPANLFVDRFGDYKVGDFGASKRMETVHVAQTMCCTSFSIMEGWCFSLIVVPIQHRISTALIISGCMGRLFRAWPGNMLEESG